MDAGRLEEPTRWWRVEINHMGTVTSCEQVENVSRNTRTVLYIRAVCREHALEEATQWLERRRAKARVYDRKRRRARQAKGICESCSEKVCKGSKVYCAKHLAKYRDYHRGLYHVRKAGETPRPAIDPVEAMARDAARRQRYQRMQVQLHIVLAVFDQVDGRLHSGFRQWLVDEIAQRGGRDAQAAE